MYTQVLFLFTLKFVTHKLVFEWFCGQGLELSLKLEDGTRFLLCKTIKATNPQCSFT